MRQLRQESGRTAGEGRVAPRAGRSRRRAKTPRPLAQQPLVRKALQQHDYVARDDLLRRAVTRRELLSHPPDGLGAVDLAQDRKRDRVDLIGALRGEHDAARSRAVMMQPRPPLEGGTAARVDDVSRRRQAHGKVCPSWKAPGGTMAGVT